MRIAIDLDERDRRILHTLSQSLGVRSDVLVKEAIREFLHRNGQACGPGALTRKEPAARKVGPDKGPRLNG